ncbi:MAG: Spo0B domain-containing protein [Bacillota bacterium]
MAGREAFIEAQEQLVREMQGSISTIRSQRHDFINHVQVLHALLQENRVGEMKQYLGGIKREIDNSTIKTNIS